MAGPFIDMYLELDENVTNATSIYWKVLPIAMYWPFDAHSSFFGWASCFIFEGLWAVSAPFMITAAIILCFYACEALLGHMQLLIYAINHLDERARDLFKIRYNQDYNRKFEKEYDECYYECIVENVKHHHKIINATYDFMEIANYAIAVPFFGGALLLGLAGLNLLAHDDSRIGPKIFLSGLATSEAINMLLLCIYGERFSHESTELFNAVFYTKWYKRSLKCRRAIMIMQLGTIKPVQVTAAKMITLNMATFSNLVNSAYSIFNLNSVASSGDG